MKNTHIVAIVLVFVIALYLYHSKKQVEQFSISNPLDVAAGASKFYDWGLRKQRCKKEEPDCSCDSTGDNCYTNVDNSVENRYNVDNTYVFKQTKESCGDALKRCPIWEHPDIDKYVLKSSVPPCPDTRNFATKSMMCPCHDPSKYILKSEIKPDEMCKDCPTVSFPNPRNIEDHPDFKSFLDKHMKKYFSLFIGSYDIRRHPDFKNYISIKEHEKIKCRMESEFKEKMRYKEKSHYKEKSDYKSLTNDYANDYANDNASWFDKLRWPHVSHGLHDTKDHIKRGLYDVKKHVKHGLYDIKDHLKNDVQPARPRGKSW